MNENRKRERERERERERKKERKKERERERKRDCDLINARRRSLFVLLCFKKPLVMQNQKLSRWLTSENSVSYPQNAPSYLMNCVSECHYTKQRGERYV